MFFSLWIHIIMMIVILTNHWGHHFFQTKKNERKKMNIKLKFSSSSVWKKYSRNFFFQSSFNQFERNLYLTFNLVIKMIHNDFFFRMKINIKIFEISMEMNWFFLPLFDDWSMIFVGKNSCKQKKFRFLIMIIISVKITTKQRKNKTSALNYMTKKNNRKKNQNSKIQINSLIDWLIDWIMMVIIMMMSVYFQKNWSIDQKTKKNTIIEIQI